MGALGATIFRTHAFEQGLRETVCFSCNWRESQREFPNGEWGEQVCKGPKVDLFFKHGITQWEGTSDAQSLVLTDLLD